MYTVTVKPFDLHLDALKRDVWWVLLCWKVDSVEGEDIVECFYNEFINFGTGNEIEMDSIANLSCWYRMVSLTVIVVTHIKLIWIMTCDLCLLIKHLIGSLNHWRKYCSHTLSILCCKSLHVFAAKFHFFYIVHQLPCLV